MKRYEFGDDANASSDDEFISPENVVSNENDDITASANQTMTHYEFGDIDDIIANAYYDDDFISPENYVPNAQPVIEEAPLDDSYATEFDESPAAICKDGDITALVNQTAGCVSGVDHLPKPSVERVQRKQKDSIMTDRIPILLHEKYFKFPSQGDSNNDSGIEGRFSAVFSDSDEDNTTVNFNPVETSKTSQKPKPKNGASPQYYNPFEIYQMKRGKKDAKRD